MLNVVFSQTIFSIAAGVVYAFLRLVAKARTRSLCVVEIEKASVPCPSSKHGPAGVRKSLLVPNARPEISYGIALNTQVSARFPVVWRDGQWRANGVNLEAQYIAPHEKHGIYLGGRIEVARSTAPQGVESRTSFEVRPILGYRDSDLELILNVATRKALGGESRRWKLDRPFQAEPNPRTRRHFQRLKP